MPVTPALKRRAVEERLALDGERQAEQQQRHGQEEAETSVKRNTASRDRDDAHRVREIVPGQGREGWAVSGAHEENDGEAHHQGDDELGQHAGPGRGQRAERQIAADGPERDAGNDEGGAGDVVSAQGRKLLGRGRFLRHFEVPKRCPRSFPAHRSARPDGAEVGWSSRTLLRPHVARGRCRPPRPASSWRRGGTARRAPG